MVDKSGRVIAIRLFGLSNVALQTELSRVEDDFEIEFLSTSQKQLEDRDSEYYPQFEESIRKEASAMAHHYEIFYCLEKSIRGLIEDRLKESGADWWDQKVPRKVVEDVEKRIQNDMDSAVTLRSMKPIDYTTFGELGEIIKANWDIFGDTFNSVKAVEKVMANLNVLRGPIAHCSQLASDEVTRLQLSLRDWFRLMA